MDREPLEGIAQADAHLGRPVPLPAVALPLARWVEVVALGPAREHGRFALREAPLEEAEEGLRPVVELAWEQGGLHLRLTGQGPWSLDALVAIADSVRET